MRKVLARIRKAFSLDRLLGLGLLAAFLVVYWADPLPLEILRTKTFDFYQKLKPRPIPPAGQKLVTIVDLDEESLATVGQWPWPRTTIAQMIHNLSQMGAAVIGFDIVFPEPDRMNPALVADVLTGLDAETRARLEKLKSNDQVLGETIGRARNVVVGQAGYWEVVKTRPAPPIRKSVATKGSKPGQKPEAYMTHYRSLVHNVAEIEKPAAGHGVFSLENEPDGIVRRVPVLFYHDGGFYPALSVEMLRVLLKRPTILVETDVTGIKSLGIARGFVLPTDPKGRLWPYFSYHDKDKYVSAKDVLSGTVKPEMIKGKMVLIGTSAVGLLDVRSTPLDPVIPGVEVHAQVIENAVADNGKGTFLARPGYFLAAELAVILVGGLLMIILVPWVGAKWTMAVFAVIVGAAAGTSWYAFIEYRFLLDAGFAIISIFLLYALLTYTGYAREEASRRQVREAFAHYLSPDMVERLAENPDQLKLGGEQRPMTLLFCDVRGFTTISEQFTAVGLTQLINKLLTPLTNVILQRRGTIDKYMGDCIMAFWNAPLDDPDHARNGCLSALAMIAEMKPLNERLQAEAITEGRKHIPLKVGVGLNSGPAVVGNMGSDMRFDYSVLGDTVNTASRLEGQSKGYGVSIVIGESTRKGALDLATLELDLIKVKGKTEAVRIFTLLGDDTMAQDARFQKLKQTHDEMLAAYRGQNWRVAREKIAVCRKLCEPFYDLNALYDLYAERITEFVSNPPGPDWDGVYVATSK